ncbi:MAG: hypothetical protein R3320_07665 [Nitriliruptorales bacterium]|nr:hypothetical protein [Nitriliruptorales bacterium]
MALEPGTHGIVAVEPLPVRDEHAAGEWSCSVCGDMHEVRSTWVLTYRPDNGPDLRFILCPSCAKPRIPIHAVIDLDALARMSDSEELQDHVELVQALRSGDSDRYLPLRDADLYRLSEQEGMTVDRYVDDLEGAGVLRRRGPSV